MIPEFMRRRRGFGARSIELEPSRRADILRILNAGWHRALVRPEVGPATREVELTGHLRAGMIAAVNDRVVTSHKRISVLPGTESRFGTDVAPSGLTDISIHLREIRERTLDHGPHAIIECKRVAANDAALCRLYVVEGIDRFRNAKYGGRHTAAFMAAYVLSGSVDAVTRRINGYLSDHDRDTELLAECTVLVAAWARSSQHPRQLPAPAIDLHHAFLTFQTVPD